VAGSTIDQAPRGRHTVSLFVLAIVVVSLLVQRLVSGANGVTLPEGPVPSVTRAPAAAAAVPTARTTETAQPSPTTAPSPAPPPPTATPQPSPTPVPPSPTQVPPTATAVPPTPTPVPPTSTPAPPPPTATRPAAPPAPAPAAKPGARTVRIIRDAQSRPALLRARSDVGALVIGEIPVDTLVEVLGQENGQAVVAGNNVWYRVSFGGQTGYVYSALAAPTG
jgi:hypothetical protein